MPSVLPNPGGTYGNGNSTPSGVVNGVMASTNVIYSNIIDMSRYDNIGLEVTFTGTPTGVFSVLASNSGISFYTLTFNPAITQPAGAAGGFAVAVLTYPFKYFMLEYANASGSGILTVYGQAKAFS